MTAVSLACVLALHNLAATEPAPAARALEDAREHMLAAEIEEARALLVRAIAAGHHDRAGVVALHLALGEACAYVGDALCAESAFATALYFEPGAALAYTTSPKATQWFEQVRARAHAVRALSLDVSLPTVARLGSSLPIVVRMHDARQVVREVVMRHRVKGLAPWREVRASVARDTESVVLELPAIPDHEAQGTPEGRGVVLEVALAAADATQSTVWQGPSEQRPLELPVGFDAPPPWWGSGWFWASAGVVATAAVGLGVTLALWPLPDDAVLKATMEQQ